MPANLMALESVFGSLISGIIGLVGAAAVVMLVVGGFQYLQAGSDKDAAARAWRTLTFAVGGLILTASAYMILNLFGSFIGVDLSSFNLSF
jgi:hypothetical protein